MPSPYVGCLTCKQRHLKCDGSLPVCTRCLKAKRHCHGSKDVKDIAIFIHSENAYASGKRKRPRGPRPASPELSTLPSRARLGSTSPAETLADVAITYYIKTNLSPAFQAPSLLRTVEDELLFVYRARQTDPIIRLALSVLSLVLYGRIHSDQQALTQACQSYEQLLLQTRSILSSSPAPSHQHIETTLFVTFCMSRYEDAVHEPDTKSPGIKFTSASHHDGSLALLRAVADVRTSTRSELPGFVKSTRRCMIKSALLRSKELPEWIQDGELFGETELLDVTYDRFSIRLVHLRHQLHLMVSGECSLEPLAVLINRSYKLGKDFGEWSASLSAAWSRPSLAGHDETGTVPEIHTRDDIKIHAALCLRIHAADTLIISTYISFLLLGAPSPELAQARARIRESASAFTKALQIFAGKSTHINDAKSMISPESGVLRWVIWPLSMILLAEEMDRSDRLIFEDVMKEVGRISGFAVLEDVGIR